MTRDILVSVARACSSALEATTVDGSQCALDRARHEVGRMRQLAAPRSRHRRRAEEILSLTSDALAPLPPGFLATVEQELGDREEALSEAQRARTGKLVKASNAVRRVLSEVG